MGSTEALQQHNPITNVELFERVRDDGSYLQLLADLREDDVLGLLGDINFSELVGTPVTVRGGEIQVGTVDEDMDTGIQFVPNTELSGTFRGLAWRRTPSEMFEGELDWHLCHVIHTGTDDYSDDEGNHHKINYLSFVSVSSSEIELMGQVNSHDYRRLANDGFCLRADQMIMDEAMNDQERLEMLTRMFGEISHDHVSAEKTRMMQQRISYLNHMGIFRGLAVRTPVAIAREQDGSEQLVAEDGGGPIIGRIALLGFDHKVTMDDEGVFTLDQSVATLSLEIEVPGFGYASAPVISGHTTLFV